MDGGWKAAAGASPLREKMGRGCISWPVQCWIRYPYNAHCHSVPSTEVVYKCELPLSSRLRKYMKRRSSYLTMNQIPCLSNKNTNRTGQKSKQISAGIKVHVTYISHICNAYDLTAALSETAEWLKNDFSTNLHGCPLGCHCLWLFGSANNSHAHTHIHGVASHFDQGILTESVDCRRPTGPGFALGFLFWPLCRLKRPVSL